MKYVVIISDGRLIVQPESSGAPEGSVFFGSLSECVAYLHGLVSIEVKR